MQRRSQFLPGVCTTGIRGKQNSENEEPLLTGLNARIFMAGQYLFSFLHFEIGGNGRWKNNASLFRKL